MRSKYFIIFIIIVFSQISGFAQNIFRDEKVVPFFNALYSYSFQKADSILNLQFPNSTNYRVNCILSVYYEWWMLLSGDVKQNHFANCQQKLDCSLHELLKIKDKTDNDIFLIVNIYAYKARLELLNDNYFSALPYLSQVVDYLDYIIENEANSVYYQLMSGLYKYSIAHALEKYPIIYPSLLFMPKGNKKAGIELLENCSKSDNLMVNTEAKYFLTKIYLETEKNIPKAKNYCEQLLKQFPNNLLYHSLYLRIALLINDIQFIEAEKLEMRNRAKNNFELTSDQKLHFFKNDK